jgi:hypothetical protein
LFMYAEAKASFEKPPTSWWCFLTISFKEMVFHTQ